MKRTTALIVAVSLLPAFASAKDLLTREQFIDYNSKMKCAEMLYSYTDPDKFAKEQEKIDKAFGVKEKDIEAGKIDALMDKYGSDAGVLDAVDAKVTELCPVRE